MARRRATRIAGLAALAALGVAAWAVFAPPELGGSTRYVVTQGSSMEPKLHAGDLALVRADGDVAKGDVVLYGHPRLGTHVLHRIVRVDSGRYVLKGDSNEFLDDVRPSAEQIDGRLWVTLPRVGAALMWAREPLHLALLVFALAFLALGGGAALSASRTTTSARPRLLPAEHGGASWAGGVAKTILTGGLAALGAFAVLAVVSLAHPATRTQALSDAYAQVGSFSYGAAVDASDVYPDGRVDTGETAFLSLVPSLDVEFDYRLRARDVRAVRGTTALRAVLSDGAGWSREILLGGPAGFTGPSARARGRLDLVALATIVEEMKALTGSGTTTFALALTADTVVRGTLAGAEIRDSFSPELPLLLDTVSLRPDSAAAPSATVRKVGSVSVDVPAFLALGALRIQVDHARAASLLGLVLAALVVAASGAVVLRNRPGGEPSHLDSRFGDRLITITRPPSVEPVRVTELNDAASLQRLAEHLDRIVLHWRDGRDHVYEVDDAGSAYRYRVALGVEPGLVLAGDDEDTAVLPPSKLPSRAATG